MPHEANRRLRVGDTSKRKFQRNKSDKLPAKDQSRIPATPKEAASAYNYSDVVNQRRNANAMKKMQPRRPVTPTPGMSTSEKPPLKFPDEPSTSKAERKQHPLALSGGRHPPERSEKPKFSSPSPTKQDTSTKTSKAPQTAKAPASGTMSHTPENPSQRGSVTSGGDKASSNFIGGVEAVKRAASEAERNRLERQLWGIGGNPR